MPLGASSRKSWAIPPANPVIAPDDGPSKIAKQIVDAHHGSLTCDGEMICEMAEEDRVMVCKKDRRIRLIHPSSYDHYSVLRAKLAWG